MTEAERIDPFEYPADLDRRLRLSDRGLFRATTCLLG